MSESEKCIKEDVIKNHKKLDKRKCVVEFNVFADNLTFSMCQSILSLKNILEEKYIGLHSVLIIIYDSCKATKKSGKEQERKRYITSK